MLRQRVITALVLAPLVLWAVLALPAPLFAALIAVVIGMGAWEWARLAGSQGGAARAVYVAGVFLILIGLYLPALSAATVFWSALVGCLWWLVALAAVKVYPRGAGLWRDWAVARAVAGLLVLVPAWVAVVALHAGPGPGYVVLLLLLVWGADTGAYFAGRRFGRRRLAPHVSPGKTWAGVGGAAAATVLIAVLGAQWLEPAGGLPALVLLSLVAVAFSILGDLTESLFKRITQIKDSGGLLPGHGGILDRIDSLTAAAPVFLLGLILLERLA